MGYIGFLFYFLLCISKSVGCIVALSLLLVYLFLCSHDLYIIKKENGYRIGIYNCEEKDYLQFSQDVKNINIKDL
jgi:hypothetical protein